MGFYSRSKSHISSHWRILRNLLLKVETRQEQLKPVALQVALEFSILCHLVPFRDRGATPKVLQLIRHTI